MAVNILIPYNFTENDQRAVDFVGLRYGGDKEASATLFHAHLQVPQIDDTQSPIMKKVVYNTAYLRQQQEEQVEALKAAKTRLMDHGFSDPRVHCIFQPVKRDIALDIIHLWKTGHFDVVVLNRNPGNIVNFFTRSISKQIVRQCGLGVHIIN